MTSPVERFETASVPFRMPIEFGRLEAGWLALIEAQAFSLSDGDYTSVTGNTSAAVESSDQIVRLSLAHKSPLGSQTKTTRIEVTSSAYEFVPPIVMAQQTTKTRRFHYGGDETRVYRTDYTNEQNTLGLLAVSKALLTARLLRPVDPA